MNRFLMVLFVAAVITPASSQTLEQLVDICVSRLDDATYLRDFQVELDAAEPGHPAPVARYSMVLNRNTQYRLSICNSDASPGRGIIELYDNRGLIGSNYVESSDTDYPSFDVQIQSTGVYHIFISFREGKPGTAVGILSLVKRL
ncbi:MAG: hypothetical protein R6U58_07510 [Bacteroidales bacterium]